MAFVSSGNHGSAAVTTVTAALLPSAGGAAAATGEYGGASSHVLARIAAPSADSILGDETISDAGSFTLSTDQPSPVVARRPGSLKRDFKSKLLPGKRLAVSLPRTAQSAQHRRASPSIRASARTPDVLPQQQQRSGTPNVLSPDVRAGRSLQTTEDRIRALEFQRAHDQANLVKAYERLNALQQVCDENTKLNMELRRDVYGTRTATEARFASTEKIIEGHLAFIVAHQAEVTQHLQGLEMQLPMAGQVVQGNFEKLATEIEAIKQSKGETFTKQMCEELEVMRQHVVAHERRITEIAGTDAHHQNLIDNLGLAYAQLLTTVENANTPPDAADMPDWQRPPRRSNGVPSERSYGGCGGCSGNS